ncbi:MAG TPA: type II secretion system F family protein [Woeseiaceae bacterium]|nr:type II secretion system F family protein [Woeseiaceae bacterium]
MLEYGAMGFAFLSAAALTWLAMTQFYPPIRAHIQSEYLDVDHTLKNIFYTDHDGRLFVFLKYGGALAAFLLGMFVFNSFIFGLFMAAIVYVIPGILLKRIVNGRRDRLEEQTSDVMTALNATIKSGMTLEESIGEIATTMRPPVAQEFSLIKERIDAGQTIVSALRAADKRLDAPRLSLILQSLIVSQERGGKLATLMEKLSVAMREIERVEERIKTETSGLVLSSRIMVFIPFVICGFLYLAEPEQVTMLFTTFVGNVILVIAIGLDILAFRAMQKIVDLDV